MPSPPVPTRNALWVLRRAALAAVFTIAGMHSVWITSLVMAEWKLQKTAKAAATEATLPKASRASVERLAVERLRCAGVAVGSEAVAIEHNCEPARRAWQVKSGDQFAVTLTTPAADWAPAPLNRWGHWFGPERIRARAVVNTRP